MTWFWFAAGTALVGVGLALGSPPARLKRERKSTGQAWPSLLLVAIVAEALAVAFRSPALAVSTPLIAVITHLALGRISRRKSRQRLQRALPAFTDELAQHLRSGGSLSAGFARVARESPEVFEVLEPVVRSVDAGERIDVALARFETEDDALKLVLLTVRILVTTGGPAASAIDRVGENVRAVIAGEEEAKALAGQGTASAAVLTALPVGFASLAAFSSDAIARFYAFEWAGAVCVAISLILTGASWFWIDALMWGRNQ